MPRDALRQAANAASVVFAVTVNIVATTLPLNDQFTGEISDRFEVYFVPAGYVFSIWGILYLGWLAFVVFQYLPAQKGKARLRRLGYWFALSGVLNAAWLFCWHYNRFGLSVLVMLGLLGTLIVSYTRLNVGRTAVGAAERWCVDIPFGAYLGWISVATIANITAYLDFINWSGFGVDPQVWAAIMLGVATALGVLMALTRRDAAYLLVFVWAFAGIGVKHAGVPLVAASASIAAGLALVMAIYSLAVRRRQPA